MVQLTAEACQAAISEYLKRHEGLTAEKVSVAEIDQRTWIIFENVSSEDNPELPPIPHLRGLLWPRPFSGPIGQQLQHVAIVTLYAHNPTPITVQTDRGWSTNKPRGGNILALVNARGILEARPATINPSDWGEKIRWPFND